MQSLGTNPAEIGLQTPAAPDRRRKLRHKVRLPAYASLNASASAPALELSEIVDISEDGMAIQTSADLGVDQQARFLLDLPETHALLPVEGKVIWTGLSGRAGVQFAEMPGEMSAPLTKWLFANAIAACAQQATSTTDQWDDDSLPAEDAVATPQPLPPAQADHTSILAALAAVKREVEALGTDLDAALCLIARRAHSFTQATGAAIALADEQEMICRATVGHDAPPLGARLQIGSGFSGECVQTGLLLRCDDAELDPRVNRESCRALGIRSMAAIPIRSNGSILGLLEVFSPEVRAFGSEAESVLSCLAQLASAALCRAESPPDAAETASASVDDEFLVEDHTALSIPGLSRSRNGLLIAAAVTLVFVILWLIATWDGRTPHTTVAPAQAQQQVATTKPQSASATAPANDLQTMLRLAEQGDPIAQFAVGARYATGEDVSQDYAEAVRWFSKAAEQGHVPAQATLGAYYWAGRGAPADLSKAYFWSVLAEAGGDEASKSRVALLASRLDRAQIVIAQHQAEEWIRKHQLAGKSSGTAQ
jgi:putative methionine-R-sulfoxide reductase with GAF domain